MRALGQYILVKPLETKNESSSGLLLTEVQRYLHGNVLSFGDLVPNLSEGDEIVFDMNAGHDIRIDGDSYKMLKYSDVFLICD